MSNKYSGIDNINKPAFDAIVPKVKEMIKNGVVTGSNGVVVKEFEGSYDELSHEFCDTLKVGDEIICNDGYKGKVLTKVSRTIRIMFITDDDTGLLIVKYVRPNVGPKRWLYSTEKVIDLLALFNGDENHANKTLGYNSFGDLTAIDTPILYVDSNAGDWEGISSSILSKVKVGDIIYCPVDETIGIVNFVSEDDINIVVPYSCLLYGYSWSSQEEAWLFNESLNRIVLGVNEGIQNGDISVGTKLYLHDIVCSCRDTSNQPISFNLRVISSFGQSFVDSPVEQLFDIEQGNQSWNCNNIISMKCVAQGEPDKLCCFSGSSSECQLIVFDATVSGNISVTSFLRNSSTQYLENSITTDIVTPL